MLKNNQKGLLGNEHDKRSPLLPPGDNLGFDISKFCKGIALCNTGYVTVDIFFKTNTLPIMPRHEQN